MVHVFSLPHSLPPPPPKSPCSRLVKGTFTPSPQYQPFKLPKILQTWEHSSKTLTKEICKNWYRHVLPRYTFQQNELHH